MTEHFKAFLRAIGVALAGLTLAQANAILGTLSLLIGISYQVWKWRREARAGTARYHRGEPPID